MKKNTQLSLLQTRMLDYAEKLPKSKGYLDFDKAMGDIFYQVSNEQGISHVINNLLATLSLPKKQSGTLRVGLGVGEFSALSFAPVLQLAEIDILLFADITPQASRYMEFLLKVFSQAASPREFMKTYLKKHPFLGQNCGFASKNYPEIAYISPQNLKTCLQANQSSTGRYYYLLPENFSKYQEIFKKIACQTIYCDISDEAQTRYLVKQLGTLFPKQKIEFSMLALSNCHAYDISFLPKVSFRWNILKCAQLLAATSSSAPIVLFALRSDIMFGQQIAQYSIGLSAYKKKLKRCEVLMNLKDESDCILTEDELKLFDCTNIDGLRRLMYEPVTADHKKLPSETTQSVEEKEGNRTMSFFRLLKKEDLARVRLVNKETQEHVDSYMNRLKK